MSMPNVNAPSFAETYERALVGPLFRPWVEILFARVGLAEGQHLLDVACGTGIVARQARARVGPNGRVVGVDLSPVMLSVARSVGPGVDWREGNAESLPLAEGESFDVVTCQQGLQFVPDKPKAVAEMHRALVPGGRAVVATWRHQGEIPLLRELETIAGRHLGAIQDRRHSFGDSESLKKLLTDANFKDVKSEIVTRTIRFDDPMVFGRLNAMALIGMSEKGPGIADDQRPQLATRIAADSVTVLQKYTDDRGLAFELATNVASGRR